MELSISPHHAPSPRFQSLEGIQALWNEPIAAPGAVQLIVSIPGRDSGSLERHWATQLKGSPLLFPFQSLEGIQALWNRPEMVEIAAPDCVSIPGRDSGSLEPVTTIAPLYRLSVSIPGRDSGSLELSSKELIPLADNLFQSLEGIQALWNAGAGGVAKIECFNPWKGFRLFGTPSVPLALYSLIAFQSLEGIQALWNELSNQLGGGFVMFQSLEGIQALWNRSPTSQGCKTLSFQSLEGIQALWNARCLQYESVCFSFNPWKGFRLFGTVARQRLGRRFERFNPWKGFRLFGTLWMRDRVERFIEFQSLEGIQALWNA